MATFENTFTFYTCFYRDNFGKTMTMTAISKGFQRVMKLLYEYENRHEKNVLNTTWSEKLEMTRNNHQNDDHLGMFNFT